MKITDFIKKLEELKPSEDLLLRNGFTSIPNVILKNYNLPQKTEPKESFIENNLIETLMNNYETQYLRFNDFSFEKEIRKIHGHYIFATSSYSFLAFKSSNGEIIEVDREELSNLYYCAKDSDAFLEALLVVFENSSLKLQGLIDESDKDADVKFIERASLAAGGKKYLQFYKNII